MLPATSSGDMEAKKATRISMHYMKVVYELERLFCVLSQVQINNHTEHSGIYVTKLQQI